MAFQIWMTLFLGYKLSLCSADVVSDPTVFYLSSCVSFHVERFLDFFTFLIAMVLYILYIILYIQNCIFPVSIFGNNNVDNDKCSGI